MSAGDLEQMPAAGDALEVVLAGVPEPETRASREVSDGRGHEHLIRTGERAITRSRPDTDATDRGRPSAQLVSVGMRRNSRRHPIQAPGVGDALQLVLARVLEHEAGADDELLDRRGDEHLRRPGEFPEL